MRVQDRLLRSKMARERLAYTGRQQDIRLYHQLLDNSFCLYIRVEKIKQNTYYHEYLYKS